MDIQISKNLKKNISIVDLDSSNGEDEDKAGKKITFVSEKKSAV